MGRHNITFRPISDNDMDFLYRVYASTREEELSLLDWDEAQKEAFLQLQFQAQHKHYQEYFPDASFDIIIWKNRPVGRLYIHRRPDEIRLVDIALLPQYRRRGLGSQLLKKILAEGEAAGLPVRIHVEQNNPALILYTQLGFRHIEDQGVYYLMEWEPSTINNPV